MSRMPAQRFTTYFLSIRALEVACVITAVIVSLYLENASDSTVVDKWKYWTVSNAAAAGMAVAVWYYVGFGYFFVSGLSAFLSWRYARILSPLKYAVVNLATFLVHSVTIITIVFHGKLTLAFWGAWLATVFYNVIVPIKLWGVFLNPVKSVR